MGGAESVTVLVLTLHRLIVVALILLLYMSFCCHRCLRLSKFELQYILLATLTPSSASYCSERLYLAEGVVELSPAVRSQG